MGKRSKKDNTDRERLARPQGRPVKETFDRSEGPQRERVFLPTHGQYVQEDLHLDGSPILHNGETKDRTSVTTNHTNTGQQETSSHTTGKCMGHIDRNLFCIQEKYVGMCGNALKLIKSYFSNRTQHVQIDNVLSDFANIICGVPQGSVLVPLKLCLYSLPLSAILRYHNIGYHVYADDTQLYVSFKCKQPLEAISKLNSCLADIRRWMIINKLKINDSKTKFIVFRSPQLKCDLNGLSVNVDKSRITQSSKMRDLGVIFDQFLNFDDHITAIYRNTHFHIRNIGKIRNLLSYDACSTISHALISCRLDYCNSILYNGPKSKTDRLQRLQNQWQNRHVGNILPQFWWNYTG